MSAVEGRSWYVHLYVGIRSYVLLYRRAFRMIPRKPPSQHVDDGILHLIEVSEIDRPRNALTLTHEFHQPFGNFEVYFEAAPDIPHTYKIDTKRSGILRNPIFPLTHTLSI